MSDCSAIETELAAERVILAKMIKPGVRAVQDADGSRVEYSLGNIAAQQQKIHELEIRLSICQKCRSYSGPFTVTF